MNLQAKLLRFLQSGAEVTVSDGMADRYDQMENGRFPEVSTCDVTKAMNRTGVAEEVTEKNSVLRVRT